MRGTSTSSFLSLARGLSSSRRVDSTRAGRGIRRSLCPDWFVAQRTACRTLSFSCLLPEALCEFRNRSAYEFKVAPTVVLKLARKLLRSFRCLFPNRRQALLHDWFESALKACLRLGLVLLRQASEVVQSLDRKASRRAFELCFRGFQAVANCLLELLVELRVKFLDPACAFFERAAQNGTGFLRAFVQFN